MSETKVDLKLELIKFRDKVTNGYYREHRFARYQGAGVNSIIRLHADLSSGGREIRVPLSDLLRKKGTGRGQLTGKEEGIDNYGFSMWADWARHAVEFDKDDETIASFNIKALATPKLNTWAKGTVKDEITRAFLSLPIAKRHSLNGSSDGYRINGIEWSDATDAQKNDWAGANADRILFGNKIANAVTGNVAASLGNIDPATDSFSKDTVSLAKRTAMATTWNKITPYTVDDGGEESYVLFVGTRAMRDLKKSMGAELREAWSGKGYEKNPLFKSGDVPWDNVIVTEIPEIDDLLTLSGVGSGGSSVAPCFLCGTSALAYVTGQMPRPTKRDETDYQFRTGVGIESRYGIGKIAKVRPGEADSDKLTDWGMVTLFVPSIPDA